MIMFKKFTYLCWIVSILMAVPLVAQAQVVNLLQNPSFEEDEVILDDPDYEQWWTWGYESGLNSTVKIDETEFIDGTRSLRIEPQGGTDWYFIIAYSPIPLQVGRNYTASFWAKAEEPRPLTAKMKATDNTIDWGWTSFELTNEWAEYTFTSEALNAEAKLEILCGEVEVMLWLDFVFVYEGQYVAGIAPSGAFPPVTAVDPNPAEDATDVVREVVLGWKPGEFADKNTR